MQLQTEKFGSLDIAADDVISFPEGILGFPDQSRYVVVRRKDSHFQFLQAVEEPSLAFILIMPELLRRDYTIELEPSQVEFLQLKDVKDAEIYAIVTLRDNLAEMTANLQAPIVINTKEKLGKQIVLMDGHYHTRHNILAEMQKSAYEQRKQAKQELKQTV